MWHYTSTNSLIHDLDFLETELTDIKGFVDIVSRRLVSAKQRVKDQTENWERVLATLTLNGAASQSSGDSSIPKDQST